MCFQLLFEFINITGFLKIGSAKKSTHSTTWQFKTVKNHTKADLKPLSDARQ